MLLNVIIKIDRKISQIVGYIKHGQNNMGVETPGTDT